MKIEQEDSTDSSDEFSWSGSFINFDFSGMEDLDHNQFTAGEGDCYSKIMSKSTYDTYNMWV